MEIKSLTITQFRAFEQATFEFQPGMNLLVGINGVGKSSVLDALRIAMSRVLPQFTVYQDKRINFEVDDIMTGRDQLAVELKFQAFDIPFICNVTRGKSHKVELKPNNQNILTPLKNADEQPLVVYFSTRRSVPIEKVLNQKSSTGNHSAAFAEALIHRMLRLCEFAEWWLVQDALLDEEAKFAQSRLKVMADVVTRFLDWCTNLRAVAEPKTTLLLDKYGETIDVKQLSDGERGLLALVLDLARRLCQANPYLEDPLENGKAVVLIDELDLHLHPRWQRNIVYKLTETFPSCQFIASTHSPFIIQSLVDGQLINLDPKSFEAEYADKSIEDITEDVMGVEMPQKSERYKEMMRVAEDYFRLLRTTQPSSPEEQETLKRQLDELTIPFSDDPTYMALLKVERETILGRDDHAPS